MAGNNNSGVAAAQKRREAVSRIDKTLRLMRCFEECTASLAQSTASDKRPLPLAVCYQRAEVYLKLDEMIKSSSSAAAAGSAVTTTTASTAAAAATVSATSDSNVYLFDAPIDDVGVYFNTLNNYEYLNSSHVVDKHFVEYVVTNSAIRVNTLGKWILVTKLKVGSLTLFETKSSAYLQTRI